MLTPNVVPDFTGLRVAVVGDLIADHYLFGRPTRLSREAPVMVLRHAGEEIGAGGAANVARNFWALGAQTLLFGAVGRDAMGRDLMRLLDSEQIDVSGVESVPEWVTPTKTRVLGAESGRTMHQVLRIDREPEEPQAEDVQQRVADRLRSLEGEVDALLVSDYGYGLTGAHVARAARELQARGVLVVLDPRRNFEPFRGATAMTPNLSEVAEATGTRPESLSTLEGVRDAADRFRERFAPKSLLVTMGNRGMALFSPEHPLGVTIPPAGSESVVDVSGAGDTAASAFTLGLAAGLEGPRSMRLANAASGVVVMENGTAVCPLSKLRSALTSAPQPSAAAAPVAG